MLPVAVACIAVTTITAVQVSGSATEWSDPVEETMIEEALNGIKERTALRAELVGITLSSCVNALRLKVDITEGILEGRVNTTAETTGLPTNRRMPPRGRPATELGLTSSAQA
eukprot:COSAG06_NODE_3995_length_4678_cov_1.605372_2_plen_113_part_00